jgi:hypothetical protein
MAKWVAIAAGRICLPLAGISVILAGSLLAVPGGQADLIREARSSTVAALPCKRELALTAVYRVNGRIHFEGVADRSMRGMIVRVYEIKTDDMLVTAKIHRDGTWWASAETGGHRYTWLSKFVAESGPAQSHWRRLGQAVAIRSRRMVPATTRNGLKRTRLRVKVSGGRTEHLIVGIQTGCSRYDVDDRIDLKANRYGMASFSLARPDAGESYAIYRVRTDDGLEISPPIVVKSAR